MPDRDVIIYVNAQEFIEINVYDLLNVIQCRDENHKSNVKGKKVKYIEIY